MADKSKIEWTDATWQIAAGCSRVSAGCGGPGRAGGCYAERFVYRLGHNPKTPHYAGLTRMTPGGPRWTGEVRPFPKNLGIPLRWKRPRMIFVGSQTDLFHERMPDTYIAAVLGVMAACPQHTFQVLTKRPERALERILAMTNLPRRWAGSDTESVGELLASYAIDYGRVEFTSEQWETAIAAPWPLPNVLAGFSAEDQPSFDARWEHMRQVAALGWRVWLSAEPLLGPIDLGECPGGIGEGDCGCSDCEEGFTCPKGREFIPGLSWVVGGGEAGPRARFCKSAWARSLRDQCAEAEVPFLWKQWGAYLPDEQNPDVGPNPAGPEGGIRVGKKKAGRLLDGRLHDEYPGVVR